MINRPVVLYIEDNKDNLKLVCRVLEAFGFLVHGVADGRSGIAYVNTQIPDLILLDINLPDIGGFKLAAELRQRPELVDTPIVALSANVMKQDRENSLSSGCNGFIEKPINVDILPKQIAHYLRARQKEQT